MAPELHRFSDTVLLPASIHEVFAFYTDVDNMVRMLNPSLFVKVRRADRPMKLGARYEFDVGPRNLPVTIRWSSEISAFAAPALFEDRLVDGPFSHWVHRHELVERGPAMTEIVDTVEFGAARGMLARTVNSLFIGKNIEELFRFRRSVLEERFGKAPATA
ncbi:MAG: hypothetical protein SF028_05000 [Candidatus Sumerlaeia bacterium]|nr:hypothetical protein [Candidatus Sumerlaeia bacterium]